MKKSIGLLGAGMLGVFLTACQPICKEFPEWNEWGFQNDVEHNSKGQEETGIPKLAGEVLEVFIDPACYVGNQLGVVSK